MEWQTIYFLRYVLLQKRLGKRARYLIHVLHTKPEVV